MSGATRGRGFTSMDAYEAHEEGEPIELSRRAAFQLCRAHGIDPDASDFETEVPALRVTQAGATFDAWRVLQWLGY